MFGWLYVKIMFEVEGQREKEYYEWYIPNLPT